MSDIFNQHGNRAVIICHKLDILRTVILFHGNLDLNAGIRSQMLFFKFFRRRLILRRDRFFFRNMVFFQFFLEFIPVKNTVARD